MIVEIIKEEIDILAPTDSIATAMDVISQEEISEVIVCDDSRYLYMIRELDIMSSDAKSLEDIAGGREGHFVYEQDHILKAFQKVQENDLTIIPIIDKELNYKGAVRKDEILDFLSESYSISDKESVIILEHFARDYSLTEICNIIEQEGGKILGVLTSATPETSEKMWISLTIHTNMLQQTISSLERHEYNIVAHMSNEENETIIKERYESLMTFLNV